MQNVFEGKLNASGLKFAIVVSRFNDFICGKLTEGAIDALIRCGARNEDIDIFKTPGAWEIPLVAKRLGKTKRYDAIICLGAVIRGATPHFEYISSEVSKGIANITLELEIPISFGILTTDNLEQAIERAGLKVGNKGYDAAIAAIEMVNLFKESKV
jgi:6,7-dimethyl-8-ribityllumazine synthase